MEGVLISSDVKEGLIRMIMLILGNHYKRVAANSRRKYDSNNESKSESKGESSSSPFRATQIESNSIDKN